MRCKEKLFARSSSVIAKRMGTVVTFNLMPGFILDNSRKLLYNVMCMPQALLIENSHTPSAVTPISVLITAALETRLLQMTTFSVHIDKHAL